MRRSDAWNHSSSESSKSVAELCDRSKNSYPGNAAMTKKMPTTKNIWRIVNFNRTTRSAVHGMAKSARNVRAERAMSHQRILLPLVSTTWFHHLVPQARRRSAEGHVPVVVEACQSK